VLHGEQYTELKRPLPRAAKLTHRGRVKDIFDKGKNALVVQEIVSYDEAGNELVRNEITTLVRGAGGWGGDRGPSADINVPPDRAPDKVIEEQVPVHQALLYRLSGDWNPLHADPGMAKAFGFDKPILHGLCSFGYAGRHVIAGFAPEGNPDFMKSIRVRFAKTVLPGDTLVTEMWKESDQKIVFQTKVKERNEVVISNAAVEFWKEIPKPAAKPKAAAAGGAAGGAGAASAMPISADIFNAMNVFVKANADVAEKVKTVFQFKLSAPDSVWTIDLGTPPGSVTAGAGHRAEVHARAERRRLHGHGHRPGRPDEAVLDGQAEDLGRRDGVAEARLPEEDHAGPGAGGDEEARGRGGGGGGRRRRRAVAARRPATWCRPPGTCSSRSATTSSATPSWSGRSAPATCSR
jgi:3-hydroxyacyl-CoA dehydrogenase/3a,7a,12a-trihydroxy-5b-cholest-24-enoyl-CoA hydratase